VRLITVIRAQKLLKWGCEGYLCNVVETKTPEVSLRNIPVVQEFPNVFPREMGMPLTREVEFCIDLIPGATPISRAQYRMALMKLKELTTQLDELLEKGHIRPSTSPWGASALFIKKDGTLRLCVDYRIRSL